MNKLEFAKLSKKEDMILAFNQLKDDYRQLFAINDDLQSKIDKAIEFINKHCVNEKISKEVGYKCYTMADTNELEKIMNILGDDE